MNNPTLSSTFFLTFLLAIGLWFFIKASVKDRIETVQLIGDEPQSNLLEKIQNYFEKRAYKIATVDAQLNQVTYEGYVQPSLFLAFFLSFLAALGLLCLSLVLSLQFASIGNFFCLLVLLAPLTGVFYWRKAGRWEKVLLKVESVVDRTKKSQNLVTVTGHRDELSQLRQSLPLEAIAYE